MRKIIFLNSLNVIRNITFQDSINFIFLITFLGTPNVIRNVKFNIQFLIKFLEPEILSCHKCVVTAVDSDKLKSFNPELLRKSPENAPHMNLEKNSTVSGSCPV